VTTDWQVWRSRMRIAHPVKRGRGQRRNRRRNNGAKTMVQLYALTRLVPGKTLVWRPEDWALTSAPE
jgi:hypothetical protein